MASQFAVDLVLKTQGLGKLKSLTGETNKFQSAAKKAQGSSDRLGRALGGVGAKAGQATNGINRTGRAARGATKSIGGLRSALLGLGVGFAVKKAFGDASALESAETRINSLTKAYSKFDGVQAIAAKSAEKFRITQTEALQTYADLGSRLGGTTVDLKDLENIYEGFNTLLINNKVEAQQAAAAQLQLGQALGEGVLRAEEYNSLIATTPQLLDEVARVLKVPRDGLKKLAGEGKISSEALIQALANIKNKGADQLKESLDGAYGASKDFNKASSELSTTIGTELFPAIVPLLQAATELLKAFGQLPGPIKTATVAIAGLGAAALIAAPAIGAIGSGLATLSTAAVAAGGPVALLTTKATALGVALKGAAAAALLNPFVALAAGVVAVGAAAFGASQKINEMRNKMKDLSGSSDELRTRADELKAEIKRLEGNLQGAGNSARGAKRKIDELKAALEAIEGTYTVRLNFEIAAGDIAEEVRSKSIKNFDTLTASELDEALGRGAFAPPTGGGLSLIHI